MSPAERVLVLAPFGRDATLAAKVIGEAGFGTMVCQDIDELCRALHEGAGLALVAEEALGRADVERLRQVVAKQPAWSDFPFVLLGVHEADGRLRRFVESANVTILERPLRRRTLLAAVTAALRARRKQYAARRAIQERDEFLAMLGHELRNPLGAIRLATTLLVDPGNKDSTTPLRIIERQTSRLVRLVDDLLDVSRVTSGKVQLRLEPVDLHEILLQSAESVAAIAPAAQVTVHIEPAPEPITVIADAARLEQVFSNLLTNAIKYTPAGGRVDMETTVEGHDAVVRIRDTGVGIPADMLDHIFDIFAQVETSLDRSRGGMGIGLTLVRDLVELHGGTVTATSRGAGQGTDFYVRLPRSSSSPRPKLVEGPTKGPRRHIVVVEDNDDIRASFRMVLAMAGHTVEEASDGQAGAEMIIQARPSAAFVDIGLPTMDGYEVARRVRAQGSETILIAVTGYGQPEDRQRALDAGFDRHLTKPVDIDDIERVLADLPAA